MILLPQPRIIKRCHLTRLCFLLLLFIYHCFSFILVLIRAHLILTNVVQVCLNSWLKRSSLKASLSLPLPLVTMVSIFFFKLETESIHASQTALLLGNPFPPLSWGHEDQASTTSSKVYWQVLVSILSCCPNCFISLGAVTPDLWHQLDCSKCVCVTQSLCPSIPQSPNFAGTNPVQGYLLVP